MKINFYDIIKFLVKILLFIGAVFVAQVFQTEISSHLDFGYTGMVFYVLLGITATVVAPVSTVPLIPIATNLWGAIPTALLSITAWTIGSMIAFLLARHYGKPFIKKYVSLDKVTKYENLFSKKYIFWNIVLLRMMIPVDILSYAIGLFTSVNLKTYTLATIIGISPFAFILSYVPNMNLTNQIYIGIIIIIIIYLGYRKIRVNKTLPAKNDRNGE